MIELTSAQKIGRYVQYQREKRAISLQELADRSGVTAAYLSRLENGEYETVKLNILEQLSSAFDIPLTTFLKKCELIDDEYITLPEFEFYLNEKYQLPETAISDMKLFLKFVQEKYSTDINRQKKIHTDYWQSRKTKDDT